MPVINPKEGSSNPQRTTFRPPWVKDGPSPLPMPSSPWAPRAREGAAGSEIKVRNSIGTEPILKNQEKLCRGSSTSQGLSFERIFTNIRILIE